MSGPIVRKYGFPNFDKIFGERDLQHGVDETDEAARTSEPALPKPSAEKKPAAESKAKSKAKKK